MFGSHLSRLSKTVNKIRDNRIILKRVSEVSLKSIEYKRKGAGMRQFVQKYVPMIKYHNESLIVINEKCERLSTPEMKIKFVDGTTKSFECVNVEPERILEYLVDADDGFKEKEKVEFFGKEIEIEPDKASS
ncbi:hypothetical protein AAMO2058_000858600 [Amorphochlora amoebiformis]